MKVNIEAIKKNIEDLETKTGEQYYAENADSIKANTIKSFEATKANDLQVLKLALTVFEAYKIEDEVIAESKEEEENKEEEQESQAE